MITDEMRHEVAERMRGYDVSEFKESAIVPFLDCLGVGYLNWREVLDSLADLIEPEPERTCRMIDNGCELCCSLCDTRHGYDDEPNYCMGCGAKVVDDARI